MTTISILGSSLARVEEDKVSHAQLVHMTTTSILETLARVDGEAAYSSRAVHRRSLVYEEWMDKDG